MSASLLLLAAAVVTWSPHRLAAKRLLSLIGRSNPRGRWLPPLPVVAAVMVGGLIAVAINPLVGIIVTPVVWWVAGKVLRPRPTATNELALAATWDLLAACLSAGMPVPAAIRAVAADLPLGAGSALRDTADLLALGGDPVQAWSVALDCPDTTALARGARRTARSGAALAGVARALAVTVRERAGDAAEARAQRAAVLITGPLGLCFLPAFLCLGIVPVVIGLASRLAADL